MRKKGHTVKNTTHRKEQAGRIHCGQWSLVCLASCAEVRKAVQKTEILDIKTFTRSPVPHLSRDRCHTVWKKLNEGFAMTCRWAHLSPWSPREWRLMSCCEFPVWIEGGLGELTMGSAVARVLCSNFAPQFTQKGLNVMCKAPDNISVRGWLLCPAGAVLFQSQTLHGYCGLCMVVRLARHHYVERMNLGDSKWWIHKASAAGCDLAGVGLLLVRKWAQNRTVSSPWRQWNLWDWKRVSWKWEAFGVWLWPCGFWTFKSFFLGHLANLWVPVSLLQTLRSRGILAAPPARRQSADCSVQLAPTALGIPRERVWPRFVGLALFGFPFICLGLVLPTLYILVFLFQPVSV